MANNGKTIKQIADELGVSKQAIHKRMKKEPLSTSLQRLISTVDGIVYISVDGEKLIKSTYLGTNRQPVDINQPSTVDGWLTPLVDGQNELYKILKNEMDAKNEQIATQAAQINALQAELAAERQHSREQADKLVVLAERAQQLHAGTIQQQLTEGGVDPASPDEPSITIRYTDEAAEKQKSVFGFFKGLFTKQ